MTSSRVSTGSVPSLLQPSVTGLSAAPSSSNLSGREKKSPDAQSCLSDVKGEEEATVAKPMPQSPPEGNPSSTLSARKVRAGSPVPEKVLLSGRKAPLPPVVTGKLKIATSDSTTTMKQDLDKASSSAKVAAKEEEAKDSGRKAASKSAKVESKEPAPVEDKKIHNGDLARSPSPEKTLGKKKEGKQTKTTDTANSSSGQQQDNASKSKKAAKTETKPDEITINHVCNGTQEPGEEKASTDDQKHKKMNGTHTEEDPGSRSSSVASDVTSPDVSQKTYKRTRSGKLAGIMNKFEVDEPSKGSDKVKPKKVGKISGLASVFESGKDQAPSKPDLASLKSPEKKAPEPKPVSIAGITTSKFGGVAKFKKPGDTKKEESKPTISEDMKKSSKESAKKKDEMNGVADNTEVKKTEKTDKNDKESAKKTEEMNRVAENTENNKDKKVSEKVEKRDKEAKKKDEVNGVTDNKTENKIKTASEEKTEKSDKETKKIEVNGVINKTENKIKTASEEKTEKSDKETKIEVNGVAENTEISVKPKKPFGKKGKISKESSLEKKDQVNGVTESCEIDQENKKSPDKTIKDQSVRRKDYVNGHVEGMEDNLESKTQSVSKKTEKTGETTPSVKKKSYMNGIAESVAIDGVKKAHKTESEIDTSVKTKEKPGVDVKKEDTATEIPQTLTNGDLGSDESSLSSACDFEVKGAATAALGASVTAAAAGRGETGQGARPKGSVKPLPAREGDNESKITLGRSDSAKGTKDSTEKEAVSKGVKGKVEGKADATIAPTVKGREALATSAEVAKKHAAKLDKSHSKPTEVVAEQEVTPTGGAACRPQPGDEARPKENDIQGKTEFIAAPKTEGTLAACVDQKNKTEATPVPQLAPQASNDTAAGKAVAEAVVQAAGGAEALVTVTTAQTLREAPEITTPSFLAQQTSTSLSLGHKPEGEKIEIRVIPKATIADQPLTKIKVIANATVSDQHFTLATAAREASQDAEGRQSLAVGRVPSSSSAPQLSMLGASGYSWKTNRIRRKLNDAIENTETMLPRLESEVEDLLREAEDYLAPERRARRSWTPTFPRIITRGSCPALSARRARSHGEDEDEVFEDALDPSQLDTLMPLPDVQAERERRSRSRTPMEGPERSPSNNSMVAQAEALLSETDRLLRRSRSDKSLRRSYSRSLSSATLNKLAEVTADLSEEHNTAHLAGERLEAEQAERMKLEKEVERLQNNMRMMSTANGKLEMEKQALQSEVLNGEAEHDDEEAADASLYRRKYEWCLREIELLKKQLKQQQEDDLDHLLLLKKQLEKKVADAYEETEEQRQVVAQVKRKSQRIQAEMNDLKILLEEQTSRNNLLEKKQRKFDQDMMAAQEELRHERTNKDKVQREKDQILSEKYSFEQEVATLKLELELKEEKLTALNRQLEDLNFTGKSEEEVAVLKKAKHDLELRVKDQEEELDDLAGQVQMLEGAKVRLEMSIEQMRKENRREVSQREEELEEVRLSAQKKIKALESQLENEHEERTLLVREKHELERRVSDLQDRNVGQVDEEYVHKLKKELKKTKALLRDTQTMLEKSQSEGGQKLLIRQLKTQLEDAEFAKTAAIKARQCAEADLSDLTSQMEEAQRSRKEAEDRCARIGKERAEIQTQLEESEEEVAEVMKKYKSVVSQLSVDQITLSEQTQQIAELEHEKQVLHERLLELSSKVEVLEGETANIHTQRRLELKIKEVESKLELEQTTRQRLESQISRLKDQLERVTGDCDSARLKEAQAVEQNKRVARQLRDAKEDLATLQQRHTDAVNKKSEMEKQLELADSEVATLKSDLKLAFKRIEDLQQAIQGDLNDSDSDLSDSDSDSDGSLSSYLTASLKQQMSSSNSTLRTPPSEVHQLDRAEQPTSPCSEAISEDLDEAAATRESFA
ncbi:centrosome-associated protein CEP250-like isoform X4 [Scylla paramamosain]|uniref:centrosome-associated protein CEP250-like isoform X4 n=1 Tax=Scylla paramamosain TaxID=85552 RepID=UPI003083C60B